VRQYYYYPEVNNSDKPAWARVMLGSVVILDFLPFWAAERLASQCNMLPICATTS
jgi:hypothetical protein